MTTCNAQFHAQNPVIMWFIMEPLPQWSLKCIPATPNRRSSPASLTSPSEGFQSTLSTLWRPCGNFQRFPWWIGLSWLQKSGGCTGTMHQVHTAKAVNEWPGKKCIIRTSCILKVLNPGPRGHFLVLQAEKEAGWHHHNPGGLQDQVGGGHHQTIKRRHSPQGLHEKV